MVSITISNTKSLPHKKDRLVQFKLLTNDNCNVTKLVGGVGKGENAGHQYFLLFSGQLKLEIVL